MLGKKEGIIKWHKKFRLNRIKDACQEVVGNNVEDVAWGQTMEALETQLNKLGTKLTCYTS